MSDTEDPRGDNSSGSGAVVPETGNVATTDNGTMEKPESRESSAHLSSNVAARLVYTAKAAVQRLFFSFEQFSRHEMANHAAAGAYSFLLSAAPAILVVVYLSSLAVASTDTSHILDRLPFLTPLVEAIGGRSTFEAFLATPMSGIAGIFGLVNLLWAARLFIVSIQRGMRVIYTDRQPSNAVRENILTFALELIVIVAVVVLIALSSLGRAALDRGAWTPSLAFLAQVLSLLLLAMAPIVLWLFIFISYRTIPARKPPVGTSLSASILCTATYMVLSGVLGMTINSARYGLLYGLLGGLVTGLIKVYFFFWLYFFFAELSFTIQNFDSILFARFHTMDSASGSGSRLEKALFSKPGRLFRRYARDYHSGEIIFAQGDGSNEAMYLYRGTVGIWLTNPAIRPGASPGTELHPTEAGQKRHTGTELPPISTVHEGQFFGEMAWILEEPRSAWAMAITDCTVFSLPPELFDQFLSQDPGASRRLAGILAARLKANNDRMSTMGAP